MPVIEFHLFFMNTVPKKDRERVIANHTSKKNLAAHIFAFGGLYSLKYKRASMLFFVKSRQMALIG